VRHVDHNAWGEIGQGRGHDTIAVPVNVVTENPLYDAWLKAVEEYREQDDRARIGRFDSRRRPSRVIFLNKLLHFVIDSGESLAQYNKRKQHSFPVSLS
jgi:hypothetical protein